MGKMENNDNNIPNLHGFVDKNGQPIEIGNEILGIDDDVIFNGEHYYRIYWSSNHNEIQAISCTYGYLHEITQDTLNDFERIGKYIGNENLFVCD